jgi:hypothetical protein
MSLIDQSEVQDCLVEAYVAQPTDHPDASHNQRIFASNLT